MVIAMGSPPGVVEVGVDDAAVLHRSRIAHRVQLPCISLRAPCGGVGSATSGACRHASVPTTARRVRTVWSPQTGCVLHLCHASGTALSGLCCWRCGVALRLLVLSSSPAAAAAAAGWCTPPALSPTAVDGRPRESASTASWKRKVQLGLGVHGPRTPVHALQSSKHRSQHTDVPWKSSACIPPPCPHAG
jgi:hypothetical protein